MQTKLTFAELKDALTIAGLRYLASRLEQAAALEAAAVSEHDAWGARGEAERTVADHVQSWLYGEFEQLNAEVVFSHRPVMVQAWAIAEQLRELCGGVHTGIIPVGAA